MIRFKKAAAADVPVPPAGYVTLFVDTATGQPSAKDSAGVVVSLKGTDGEDGDDGVAGLPEGGTLGQVLTRSADGAAWADAPAGEGSGAWASFIPEDGVLADWNMGDPLSGSAVTGLLVDEEGPTGGIGIACKRPDLLSSYSTHERATVTVLIDITKVDAGEPISEAAFHLYDDYDVAIPLVPGANQVSFTAPRGATSNAEGMYIDLYVRCDDATNIASAWASFEVTQAELRISDIAIEAEVEPLEMTPIAVVGVSNGGSGGFNIPKVGDLSGATVIEIVGYYPAAADALAGTTEIYAERWLDESTYVEVEPPVSLPVFDESFPGIEGNWGWTSSSGLYDTIPENQASLCKLTIDGGEPMLAWLPNPPGL